MSKGVLIVVSGFSGSGKGALMERVRKHDNYALSISMTTRKPRDKEIDGFHYFFTDNETFEQKIADGQMLEYAKYGDKYYGTPRAFVEQKLNEGKDVVLEIEVQGALQVKKNFPECNLIFITPPSAAELKRRLIGRNTETMEEIQTRLKKAVEESGYMDRYDYILVNDDLDEFEQQFHSLVRNLHCETNRQMEFIEQIRKEVREFEKGE